MNYLPPPPGHQQHPGALTSAVAHHHHQPPAQINQFGQSINLGGPTIVTAGGVYHHHPMSSLTAGPNNIPGVDSTAFMQQQQNIPVEHAHMYPLHLTQKLHDPASVQ